MLHNITRVQLKPAATGTGNNNQSTSEIDRQSGNKENTDPVQDHMMEDTSNKRQDNTNRYWDYQLTAGTNEPATE